MRQVTGQFGSFDGLDNRKTVMDLFVRMGHGVTEEIAAIRRRDALKRLIALSENCFAELMVDITPCSVVEAYFAFTAITGCLGVPVEKAAKQLEEEARKQNDRRSAICCS